MLIPQNDLVTGLLGVVTVANHIAWFFKEIIPKREYAKNILAIWVSRCNQIKDNLGDQTIEMISVKNISELMETMIARPAQQLRQCAIDLFKTAAGRRLIESNPAELTNKPVNKKSRLRLTSDQYSAILEASPVWLRNAMQIALITLQRRGDVSRIRFDEITEGYLYVIQEKTQKYDSGYLKISTGDDLKKIISNCRDDIASPYLVHRKHQKRIERENCDHWTQVTPEMITREFKEVRDSLDIFEHMKMKTRPTFHDIRALSIKQYKDSGINSQELAGHSSEKMTKNYDSGHDEIRWIETKTR
ncbi:MAG: integrase [Oleiphilaceae bacterium]|jgi:integrase